MPQITPYSFDGHVEAALFLAGEPVFALADGTIRFPAGGERVLDAHRGGLLTARLDGFAGQLLSGGEDGRVMATRADGTKVSMPSRKPTPARRIGAKTSFLPAICGAFMRVSGVSISTSSSGRSRVTS